MTLLEAERALFASLCRGKAWQVQVTAAAGGFAL
jgi:hypothetical protein